MIARIDPGVDCWISYYNPPADGSKPSMNDMDLMLGDKDMAKRLMRLHDARGREKDFTLLRNGFQLANLKTALDDFHDTEKIKAVYFPEVQDLVKRITGASRVVIYDHNVRQSPGNDFGDHVKGYQGIQGPAKRIHVDATPPGAESIMSFMCKDDDVEDIKRRGYQLINVWRPLKRIDRDPLIVADMNKMPAEDLVTIPRSYFNGLTNSNYVCKYDGYNGSAIIEGDEKANGKGDLQVADGLSHGGEHSWWYWGGQDTDEVVLFSSSDCRPGKLATGAVHGSCPLPDQGDKPVRQSVECRVIAIF